MRTLRKRAALVCAAALLLAALLPFAPATRARRQASAEGFESGTKTSYAAAAVFLSTGWWYFDDALVGNLSTDRKTGAQSARIRNTGAISIVLPTGTNDVSRVTTTTRTIAVVMPNTQGIRAADWKTYRVSVDQVETLTGYDFFSNVPAAIQSVIESRVDNQ